MILRSYYVTKRSPDRLADIFYWSIIDLIVWGITSSYFTKLAPNSHILQIIISGILFWVIIWRAQQEININLLEDLWNKNLVNIFVAPLTFFEWITSFLIISILKSVLSFLIASIFAALVYHVNVLAYGGYLFFFAFMLMVNGWWVGFLVSGLILRYGTKVQNIAWSLVTLLSPFCAIYYPVTVLPQWAQYIAHILPISYVFTAIHAVITNGKIDNSALLLSGVLSLLYLAGSVWFIRHNFIAVLNKGLVKVF
jgi:ABC-2 type transport system permease protein